MLVCCAADKSIWADRTIGRPAYGGKNIWIYPIQVEYVVPKKIELAKVHKGSVYWTKAS